MTTPNRGNAHHPFASSAPAYLAAGWPAVLPVPPESKTPPPTGFTGQHGADTSPEVVEQWRGQLGHCSVALRLPDGVIGIDVDDYPKGETIKRGAATLARFEADWGPLPPTWSSTARGAGSPSGIRFYRVPPGRYRTALIPDIEIIQRHHRYAVVAPSWHHEAEAAYVWYGKEGSAANIVPRLEWLSELPARWIEGLREGAAEVGVPAGSSADGWSMLASIQSRVQDEPCAEVYSAALRATEALRGADAGSRHDSTIPRVHHLIMLGAHGHPGVGGALVELREAWEEATASEGRGGEFERMLLTSARKAVTAVGRPFPVHGDPCVLTLGGSVPPGKGLAEVGRVGIVGVGNGAGSGTPSLPQLQPFAVPVSLAQYASTGANGHSPALGYPPAVGAPGLAQNHDGYPGAGAQLPATPPAGPSPVASSSMPPGLDGATSVPGTSELVPDVLPFDLLEALGGARAFDPDAWLDQPLADAVLERVQPVTRYALDTGDWLQRGADRWEARRDLAGWAAGFMARLLPKGDPSADKGSMEQRRAARRTRLLNTPGRNAVAAAMRDAVRGGYHPAVVKVGELDRDPELLWAGGLPWDLRASGELPVAAELDPATPHLHSAATLPKPGPTPLWDRFLASIWPDPEIRAWALRVLSVSLTGYSTEVMPVLWGQRDRGKTAVVVLLMDMLGTYAISASPKLLNHGDTSHETIVYDLKGSRLAFIDEGPRSGHLAQERLKQLTGGARLKGRQVNRDGIEFEPTHTLVLTSNDEPTLTDPALRKRVRLIPCEGDIEAVREARKALGALHNGPWRAERPAVLAQLMREAAGWLDDRSSAMTEAAPISIRGRAEELAAEQDPVREWVEEETEPWEQGTRASDLYVAFVEWWRRTGRHSGSLPSTHKWGRDLTSLGLNRWEQRQGNRTHKVRPIRLRGPGGTGGWSFPGPQPAESAQPGISPAQTMRVLSDETSQSQPVAETQKPSSNIKPVSVTDVAASGVAARAESVTDPQVLIGNSQAEYLGPSQPGASRCVSDPVSEVYGNARGEATGSETGETPSSDALLSTPVSYVSPSYSSREGEKESDVYIAAVAELKLGGNQKHEPPAIDLDKTAVRKAKADTARAAKAAKREADRLAAVERAQGPLVDLPAGLDRASQTVTPLSVAEALALVRSEVASWGGTLTVDVETTGYPIGHPDYALRTAQLGSPGRCAIFDTDDPEQADAVRTLLAEPPRLEAHSAPADLVPLEHAGLIEEESGWARMWDTVIQAKLSDPASSGSDPSLKAVAPAVLGAAAVSTAADAARKDVFLAGKWLTDVESDTPPVRNGWAMIDKRSTTMIRYAGGDVLDTGAISRMLPQPSPELWERERACQRVVAPIAHRGLRLDAAKVAALTEEHTAARDELGARIRADYGIANPGSPAQVAAALAEVGIALPLTKGGKPSAAKAALEPLRASEGLAGQIAGQVLDYRHHATALSLFLKPWGVLAGFDPADPRVRSTVYTLSADTGRMSCVRFNLQQLSRQGGIRSCITALPGHVLISADFSGVEIRTMAALSQDANLIRMLREGADLHAMVAAQVFGPEWTKADRYRVKPSIFGWAYGGTIPTLASQVGVSQSVMQAIVDVFAGIAPDYVEWAQQLKAGVRRGCTEFPAYSGRTIHLDRRLPHKAPNFAVQGTAREFLVDALLRWSQTKWGGGIVVPVHDEILAMVPEAEAEEALATLVDCMRSALYGVAIEVEASTPSYFWADAS